MDTERRVVARGMISFALVGCLAGLLPVLGLRPITFALGAVVVGASWIFLPIPIEHRSLDAERTALVFPVAVLWPLSAVVVLVFSLKSLSERPIALLAAASIAVLGIASAVLFS